ncbi:MAG: radical SAM protein [Clostridia bacterium]|nr:radical SAM protein [Clostridia bacterium]
MRYSGRVFRPPSEARSLIVQVTYGCSHNTCCFCDMYKEKRFTIRPLQEVLEDFAMARQYYGHVRRVFLADGDALMRKQEDLEIILDYIRETFPECERVTSYASPGSIHAKTPEQLVTLREKGLEMVYMGLESGSDAVLELMQKGHTAAAIIAAGQKVRAAGIKLSVTAISGLGGQAMWQTHAVETGKAFSAMKPEYIGILTLMQEPGTPLVEWIRRGEFKVLTPTQILQETALMLRNIDSEGSVFRMNHASNYLNLRGTLNQDTEAMLARIEAGLSAPDRLKPEQFRAL